MIHSNPAGEKEATPMLGSPEELLGRINAVPPSARVFFERQASNALTCLVHALNNILGEHMIDVTRMKQFSKEMFLVHMEEARRKGSQVDAERTRTMFYDPLVGHFSRGVGLYFAKCAMGLKLKVVFPIKGARENKQAELANILYNGRSKSFLIFESRKGEGHAMCTKTVWRNSEEIVVILDSLQRYPREINASDFGVATREWTVYEFVKYDAREKEIEREENEHKTVD